MLIPTVDYESHYQLPVIIITKKGLVKKYRYYMNEDLLFKAYKQLKALNGFIKPLYPIVFDEEVKLWI